MTPSPSVLRATTGPLADEYDAVFVDLDGVVYIGEEPIPPAVAGLAKLRDAGTRVVFITNNASRTPEQVADRLMRLGVAAEPDDVVTSAQAAATLVRDHCGPGARVLVTGSPALRHELRAAGLHPVGSVDDRPDAVVQGYAPDLTYHDLAEAALAVQSGALWIATNADTTLPDPRGMLPGNGALVAAVATATGRQPLIAGKPARALFDEARRRTGADRPIVVGDRPETDVAGARGAGIDVMLVLSGVTTPGVLVTVPPAQRPTYLAADLLGLLDVHPAVEADAGRARCRRWTAYVDGGRVVLDGDGDRVDALRAVLGCVWSAVDAGVAQPDASEALRRIG